LSFRRLAVASALAFAVPLFAQPAFAQERQAAAARPSADRDPVVSITRHTGTFGGQRVSYTATAGETFLRAEDGTPRHLRLSVDDEVADRPVAEALPSVGDDAVF
jgi:carboxypeptidase C (cathepsin A)